MSLYLKAREMRSTKAQILSPVQIQTQKKNRIMRIILHLQKKQTKKPPNIYIYIPKKKSKGLTNVSEAENENMIIYTYTH